MSRKVDQALVALAREQGGRLSAADAIAITQRPDAVAFLLAGGLWQEALPWVLVPAAVALTREVLENASRLWAPRSALSHFSAARRDGIWVPDHEAAWITTPFASNARSRRGLEVFRTRCMPRILRIEDGVCWTPAPRTVTDLSSQLTRKQLEAVLLSAIRLNKVTAEKVELEAKALRGRKGVAMLREITALWTPERESLLEDRLYGNVCAVMPSGVTRQHEVFRANGSLLAKLDVAIEALRLGFEADGLLFHSTDDQIAYDQKRDRGCMGRGWQIARFREGTLDDHVQVQREIREIVEQRRRQLRAA